ncbi:MAG: alpha-glucan family phosphorylase [Nanoarchaeota archaeon]
MKFFDYKKFNALAAYLSMGAYLETGIPTFSGGLEMLAGDTLRSCADLRVPVAGVIQASNSGFFKQTIDQEGNQIETPVYWAPHKTLKRIGETVTINYKGRNLKVGAALFVVDGETRYQIPVFMLDTNFDENYHTGQEDDRTITGRLYPDHEQRIAQENVLGQGAIKLLKAIGYDNIKAVHMNEGHAAFATLELLAQGLTPDQVRDICAFTTHTPVAAGHDTWDYEQAHAVLGDFLPKNIRDLAGNDKLSMTLLAKNLSGYVNAVSKKHARVCCAMDVFQGTNVNYVTNGIHPKTWAVTPISTLLDRYFRNWKMHPETLDEATSRIPLNVLYAAKDRAKRYLIGEINSKYPVKFDGDAITLVWARRFTEYKRPALILKDMERLTKLAEKYGDIQLIFAGKAHPRDPEGKRLLKEVVQASKNSNGRVRIAFMEGYNPRIARMLMGGADVWLNTPRVSEEASGTSGMKAALNACINFTTFDGWVPEGYDLDPKGFQIIGLRDDRLKRWDDSQYEDALDSESLYAGLEELMETHKNNPFGLIERGRHSIRQISHFNTHRVVRHYADAAWNLKLY